MFLLLDRIAYFSDILISSYHKPHTPPPLVRHVVQTSAAIVVQPGSLDKAKAVFQKQVSMSEEDKKRSQVRGSRMAARPGDGSHPWDG